MLRCRMDSPTLDALTAAPDHHRLSFEDDQVRVVETQILPGETTPLHTHCWPSVNYVVSFAPFVRRDENGAVVLDSRGAGVELAAGQSFRSGPLPLHSLENVGDRPIHVISVEFKAGVAGA
jgi:mannose-6-phosphate isomerase-like protein (cupin superfamily)